ncbi:MAG: hypothetical protein M5U26_20670 [Planctomycetota bacterium]|nr:hypothetical protein [Planctomycetota bacterium]
MPSAELVCYNAQSAVAYSGREHSFVESVSTGGEGYFINGVREAVGSPLLEGLSVIVRPLILPGDKEIEVTLRLSNTSRVSFRKPTVLEKVAMEMAHVPVHLPDPMNPDQEREVQERAELFSIPNRDATRVGTQVVVPKGEWTLAGKLVSPDDPTVRLLALVAVELLEGK